MDNMHPTRDLACKKVLASEENKDILQGFLIDFVDIEVETQKMTLINPYSIDDYKEIDKDGNNINVLRETRRDITVDLEVADSVIEMQIRPELFFEERILYYTFDKYRQNYNRREKVEVIAGRTMSRYSSLKPVYSLTILATNYFTEDDEAFRMFELYDLKRKKRLKKNLLKIGFFEIDKSILETENHRHWQHFFKTGEALENAPDYIKKAADVLDFAKWTKEEQEVAINYEKAIADRENRDFTLWKEGEENKAIEIAKNALAKDLSVDMIAELTGLDKATIEGLRPQAH